jgi:HSP20 family protein
VTKLHIFLSGIYNQSWTAKGNNRGNRNLHARNMQRAAVNIYKTDNSYELLALRQGASGNILI